MTLTPAKARSRAISSSGRRRGHVREVAQPAASRCVLQDHGVRPRAAQDEGRREIGRVAERALPLDDDHVRVLRVERLHDGGLHLPGAELAGDGVERHAVARALDEPGLAGTDHDRLDAALVQRLREDDRGRALADGAVGAQHGDARAGHPVDVAGEHAQVLLGARAAHVVDQDAVGRRGRRELEVVVEELVQAVDDVHPAAHRLEHDAALVRRQQAAERRDPEDEVVGDAARVGDGVREVGADRDPVGDVVEVRAGIGSRLGAVDHRQDLVLLRVAHQAVGGLAVGGAEERL